MKFINDLERCTGNMSPSMRREWIEMTIWRNQIRNTWSPSMRREWIEIFLICGSPIRIPVSLHAEGVD